MFRSALLILSGNAAASLLLLARNLIIARLIPVADYGIAATFAITMAVVEMMSQLGLQQQIIQARDGDDPRFQKALQGFQVLRGVMAGVVLFFAAEWIADFLNIPHVAWAYQVMALVPVMNALQHFDIHRLNRQMRFWPVVLTGGVPALISLVAVWPLYLMFGDYKVMLWAIILQWALMMVVSHLVAERPYGLILDTRIMKDSLHFGWPLLVNGMLMFAVFNGDKLIVGRALGMETLAIFAMGFTLTLTPTLVLSKSLSNLFLPRLSALSRDAAKNQNGFEKSTHMVIEIYIAATMVFVFLTYIFAPSVVDFLLGDRYARLNDIILLLALLQGARVLKGAAAIVSMARGITSNAMLSNLPRVFSLPVIWILVDRGLGLETILYVGLTAEIAGVGVAYALMRYRSKVSLRGVFPAIGVCAVFFGVALTLSYLETNAAAASGHSSGATLTLVGLMVVLIGCVFLVSKNLRTYLFSRFF